jgi:hypothetical protein
MTEMSTDMSTLDVLGRMSRDLYDYESVLKSRGLAYLAHIVRFAADEVTSVLSVTAPEPQNQEHMKNNRAV